MNKLEKKKKFDYKWVVIGSCFLMVMVTLGFCSSPKSYFIGPITEHLGIDRSAYSINDSLRHITSAWITPRSSSRSIFVEEVPRSIPM